MVIDQVDPGTFLRADLFFKEFLDPSGFLFQTGVRDLIPDILDSGGT